MDHVILNHGQVTWMTPELAFPLLTTTPHQWEDVSAFDRFNVHRCPTRWVFSGTGLELVTRQATIRYLYHSATAAIAVMQESIQKGRSEPLVHISFTNIGKVDSKTTKGKDNTLHLRETYKTLLESMKSCNYSAIK
ncbi:uncharacterized protein TNCV_2750571 [Trichonephila clavipes]|nr:uncharacterized protein TNCV_2750571 [Trichonephila clavipes]